MLIAHLADCHLGCRQFQRHGPDGINEREADVAAAFRAAVDAILARAPDAVVIAGDLFHSVRPTNRSIIEAFTQIARIRSTLKDAPVVLIAGNHDTPRSSEAGSILKLMTSLGVDVVDEVTKRLEYPRLGLSVLAVPHASLLAARESRQWKPNPQAKYNVMVTHPEMSGYFPEYGESDFGGVRLEASELGEDWDYVALGHYHVVSEVAPRVWYSGSLEYTSPNLWGEWRLERDRHLTKGVLLADLERHRVERVPLTPRRVIHDLAWLDAEGCSPAELDRMIQDAVASCAGGYKDCVVRLVVTNCQRELAHQLDHFAIRAIRAQALHFQLDLRRPEPVQRTVGVGAPGVPRTLPEMAADYLSRRPLDAELDRDRLVSLGKRYLDEVERAETEGAA